MLSVDQPRITSIEHSQIEPAGRFSFLPNLEFAGHSGVLLTNKNREASHADLLNDLL